MRILYTLETRSWKKHIDSYCSQLWQAKMAFIDVHFTLKRENLGLRHCLTKCAIENKLLNQNCWSWYNFSQENLIHRYQLLHPHIVGSMKFRFLWATLYSILIYFFLCVNGVRHIKLIIFLVQIPLPQPPQNLYMKVSVAQLGYFRGGGHWESCVFVGPNIFLCPFCFTLNFFVGGGGAPVGRGNVLGHVLPMLYAPWEAFNIRYMYILISISERQNKLITSSVRRSLKFTLLKLIIFRHGEVKLKYSPFSFYFFLYLIIRNNLCLIKINR